MLALVAAGGCVAEYNPERFRETALSDVTPLTAPTGTDPFERAGQAKLSPDGRWVVFRGVPRGPGRAGGEAYGLFVARVRWAVDRGTATAEGGSRHLAGLDRPVRITRLGVVGHDACFSPDGFTLALSADDGAGHAALYRADGWEQAVALTDVARGVDLAQRAISPATLAVGDCDWSPDGRSIVVAAAGDGGLFSLRPDGSHVIRLGPTGAASPAVSPDGNRLAYRTASRQVTVGDVVRDVSGDVVGIKNERPLTRDEDAVRNTGPRWLPDGRRIVYATTHDGGDAELYVMRSADGTGKTRLTRSAGVDLLPAVSADGRHLIWTAARPPAAAPQLFGGDLTLPPGS